MKRLKKGQHRILARLEPECFGVYCYAEDSTYFGGRLKADGSPDPDMGGTYGLRADASHRALDEYDRARKRRANEQRGVVL